MAKAKKKESLTPEERLQAALVPESEQPYPVPGNWCWVKLKASINLYNGDRGTNYPSKKDYQSSGVPFINAGAIVDGELNEAEFNYITEEKYDTLRAGKIQQGDILYCLRGSLGKTAIVHQKFKGAISSSLCILRANGSLLKEYLYNLLCSNVIGHQQVLAENGSAQPNLSAASVMDYMIPLSPLAEQQRIVDRIESLFAKLDEAKQKAQDALNSFEPRKAAILHKAFTGELTAQWRKEHGVGMESWKALTLNDIAEYKKGPFGSSITKAMFVPKGNHTYKVYEQGNAIRKTVDYGHYYISEQKYLELKNFAVRSDDIIISCAGTIGEVFKLPQDCEPGIINQALMRVRIFSNINEQYFIYYFGEILKGDVIDQANGTAIKNIPPFKIMKAMKIELPSLPEQTEIIRILDDLLAKEQQAKEAAEGVLEQIDLMKKAILARAFRGELGTNDPREESAVELLKQVL